MSSYSGKPAACANLANVPGSRTRNLGKDILGNELEEEEEEIDKLADGGRSFMANPEKSLNAVGLDEHRSSTAGPELKSTSEHRDAMIPSSHLILVSS